MTEEQLELLKTLNSRVERLNKEVEGNMPKLMITQELRLIAEAAGELLKATGAKCDIKFE